MTRVLLLGTGPLPSRNPRRVDFPMLRTWQFLRGLLAADLDVWVVLATPSRYARTWQVRPFDHHRIHLLALPEEHFDRPDAPAHWVAASRPDVVVSAGPYRPARAAARIPKGIPLLIDLPGDPMAEAHLRSALTRDAAHVEHARRLMDAVIGRADAFAVVSTPQRHALSGILGLKGRLEDETAPVDPVMTLPVAIEPLWKTWADPGKPPPRKDPYKIVWPGAFNTWSAAQVFVDACDLALARRPELHVVVTGGVIENHAETVHARVVARIARSPWRNRWKLTGWIAASRAAREVTSAAVGVLLDKPCAESTLGSRTRLLYGAVLGLRWVLTPRCELAQHLVALGAARPVSALNPEIIADAILEEIDRSASSRPDERIRAALHETYDTSVTTAPLVRWACAPSRLPPANPALDQVTAERVVCLERTLSEIHHSVTWRTLSPIHRMFISCFQGAPWNRAAAKSQSDDDAARTSSVFSDVSKKDR